MDVFMLLAILPEVTTLYSPGKLGMVPGSIVDSSRPICLLSSLALSVHWFCVEELLVQRCQLQNRGISFFSKTPISVQSCNTRQALTPGNIPHASNGYEIRQPQKYQTAVPRSVGTGQQLGTGHTEPLETHSRSQRCPTALGGAPGVPEMRQHLCCVRK